MVPSVPGFEFDEALGAYVLTANKAIAVEVIHHGRLAPKGAWVATYDATPWHMVENEIRAGLAEIAGEILAANIANWPTDWAQVA